MWAGIAVQFGAPNQKLVNQRENVIAEHGTESNRGPKKAWENSANKEATNNPNSNYTSVHEPKYDGDNPRPYEVHHELHKDGTPLPNHTQDIDNPET